MKRLTFSAAILLAVLAIGVGPAGAQGETQDPMVAQQSPTSSSSQWVTGTVVSVNDNTIVISRDDGTSMTLIVDSQTAKPMTASVGDHVRIEYGMMGANQLHAMTITSVSATSGTSAYGSEGRTSAYGSETRATTGNMSGSSDAGETSLPETASPLAGVAIAGIALVGLGLLVRRLAHSH